MENHRKSMMKRRRKCGFRARMRSRGGRKAIRNKRRIGRSINTV